MMTHANNRKPCSCRARPIAALITSAIAGLRNNANRRWQENVINRTPPGTSYRRMRFRIA